MVIAKDGQLPLLSDEELVNFNKYLNDNNDLLIIKLHPMDTSAEEGF